MGESGYTQYFREVCWEGEQKYGQQPEGVVGSTIVFKEEEIIACLCSDQNYLV